MPLIQQLFAPSGLEKHLTMFPLIMKRFGIPAIFIPRTYKWYDIFGIIMVSMICD